MGVLRPPSPFYNFQKCVTFRGLLAALLPLRPQPLSLNASWKHVTPSDASRPQPLSLKRPLGSTWRPGRGFSVARFRSGSRGLDAARTAPLPSATNPCLQTPPRKHMAPGGGGFSVARLRSESKKRGTSARSAPVPRVFEAFGTRTSGRRRSLPPFSRPPHASSTPPTPQAPLSAPQNTPAPHPPVPASPCPRPPRAEARWGAWSSRPTRIPGNLPRQGHLR